MSGVAGGVCCSCGLPSDTFLDSDEASDCGSRRFGPLALPFVMCVRPDSWLASVDDCADLISTACLTGSIGESLDETSLGLELLDRSPASEGFRRAASLLVAILFPGFVSGRLLDFSRVSDRSLSGGCDRGRSRVVAFLGELSSGFGRCIMTGSGLCVTTVGLDSLEGTTS